MIHITIKSFFTLAVLGLAGCGVLCTGPGRLEVIVFDAEGAPTDAVTVVLTTPGGDELALSSVDAGVFEYEGVVGTYTVTATACEGAQVVEETIEVMSTDTCEDKAEFTSLDIDLDPC